MSGVHPSAGSSHATSSEGYTPAWRRLEWAGIATFAVLVACLASRLAPRAVSAPGLTLTAVLLAYLGADLFCGLVHWATDTWGSPDLPVVGPALIRPFREHHRDALAITRHDFVQTNGNSCLVSLPVLALALWLAPGAEGGGSIFLPAFLGALVCWVTMTNQFHKWAHLAEPGYVVALLQRLRLILPPAHHARHHTRPFDSHYCITTGWMNGLLASTRFFPLLEWCITRSTGAHPWHGDREGGLAAAPTAEILPFPVAQPSMPSGRVGEASLSSDREHHPDVPPNDRAEIVDALYRFAAGLDLHDRPLLASAFSRDAV